MKPRVWYSTRLGKTPFRLIASRTGVRPAYLGKHVQVSTRSAFASLAGFKAFLPFKKR
jgi:hypothetical protein